MRKTLKIKNYEYNNIKISQFLTKLAYTWENVHIANLPNRPAETQWRKLTMLNVKLCVLATSENHVTFTIKVHKQDLIIWKDLDLYWNIVHTETVTTNIQSQVVTQKITGINYGKLMKIDQWCCYNDSKIQMRKRDEIGVWEWENI